MSGTVVTTVVERVVGSETSTQLVTVGTQGPAGPPGPQGPPGPAGDLNLLVGGSDGSILFADSGSVGVDSSNLRYDTDTQTLLVGRYGGGEFTIVPTITGALSLADNSTKAATTAFVKGQGYLTANQLISVTGDVTGSGTTALVLSLPTVNTNVGAFTKVTVNAKGLVTAAAMLEASDIPPITASKVSDFDTQVRLSRLDQFASPTVTVSMNGQRLANVAVPSAAQDAANKQYVDATVASADFLSDDSVIDGGSY